VQLIIFLPTFIVSCMRLKIRYDSYYAKIFASSKHGHRLDAKNFAKIFRFPVTSNL
jgi:hypothetical protein